MFFIFFAIYWFAWNSKNFSISVIRINSTEPWISSNSTPILFLVCTNSSCIYHRRKDKRIQRNQLHLTNLNLSGYHHAEDCLATKQTKLQTSTNPTTNPTIFIGRRRTKLYSTIYYQKWTRAWLEKLQLPRNIITCICRDRLNLSKLNAHESLQVNEVDNQNC